MLDLINEQPISFHDVAENQNVDLSTVWRWSQKGYRGIRLESARQGGKRVTTLSAVQIFLERINEANPVASPPPGRTSTQRAKGNERASKRLASVGI
jgi:transposase